MTSILNDIAVRRIDGTETALAEFAGSVLLVVNVASECGLTPQYAGLETLYETYRDEGLVVLGFPSNQFDDQEPGTDAEIHDFCRTAYGVAFPMFAKIAVKGPDQHPLYRLLVAAQPTRILSPAQIAAGRKPNPDRQVRWNFEKFLVNRSGEVVARFDPDIVPGDEVIVRAIEAELAFAAPGAAAG
jgi:glutathione peroxidase